MYRPDLAAERPGQHGVAEFPVIAGVSTTRYVCGRAGLADRVEHREHGAAAADIGRHRAAASIGGHRRRATPLRRGPQQQQALVTGGRAVLLPAGRRMR